MATVVTASTAGTATQDPLTGDGAVSLSPGGLQLHPKYGMIPHVSSRGKLPWTFNPRTKEWENAFVQVGAHMLDASGLTTTSAGDCFAEVTLGDTAEEDTISVVTDGSVPSSADIVKFYVGTLSQQSRQSSGASILVQIRGIYSIPVVFMWM